jgi:hypothetical protein
MDSLGSYLAFSRLAPVQVTLNITRFSVKPHIMMFFEQIVFWGHPLTTSLPSIDYFITSPLFEHAALSDLGSTGKKRGGHRWHRFPHSEQLVRLDGLSTYFSKPKPLLMESRESARKSIESVIKINGDGIKDGAIFPEVTSCDLLRVYSCAQNPNKFHPDFDVIIAKSNTLTFYASTVISSNI